MKRTANHVQEEGGPWEGAGQLLFQFIKNSCAPAVVSDTGSCCSPYELYLNNSEVVALHVVKRAVDVSQAVCSREAQGCVLGQLLPIS